MKKIKIIALHLGYGGIERAICLLANNLSKNNDVEIISTYKVSEQPQYKLNQTVKVTYLMNYGPNKKEFKDALKKLKLIKTFKESLKAIKILYQRKSLVKTYVKNADADILISTRDFHNKILSKKANKNVITIGWEHNNFSGNNIYARKVAKSVRNLDYFILVSKDLFNLYKNKLVNYDVKCIYIPNMIEDKKYIKSKLNNKSLINISRLSPEKGLFDLIDVVSIVKNKIPEIRLDLVGDGDLYKELENYISEKNLKNNVFLHGFKNENEVHKIIERSSLYVMTSFRESFGIVLLESFVHGVPAISFDSAQGARELIRTKDFLISNRDKNKMAEMIVSFLDNSKLRNKLSTEVVKISVEYLDVNVIKKWNKIIDK